MLSQHDGLGAGRLHLLSQNPSYGEMQQPVEGSFPPGAPIIGGTSYKHAMPAAGAVPHRAALL
jgi:hypothetical protein